MVCYVKGSDLGQEGETISTVCLEFTGHVERSRKWGKGVAVCQTQSMNAPKGDRGISTEGALVYTDTPPEPTPGGLGSGLRPGRRRFLCQLPLWFYIYLAL
jgi:hypothetical protein